MPEKPTDELQIKLDEVYEKGYYTHWRMHMDYCREFGDGFICFLCQKYPGLSKYLLSITK